MKNLASLILAGFVVCFVGLGLTGCGGSQENTVVESAGEQGDAALKTEADMKTYEEEMKAAYGGGQ